MPDDVKVRPSGRRREAQAEATRREIIDAAAALFVRRGYAGTTLEAIADAAGVAVQTIYNSIGSKARLLSAALDVAAAGDHGPDGVVEREVRRGADVRDPRAYIAGAADSVARRLARAVPLLLVVSGAASTDPEIAALESRSRSQRFAGLTRLAAELSHRDGLRAGLTVEGAAARVWALASPDAFRYLVLERGWSLPRYRRWLEDALASALLPPDES